MGGLLFARFAAAPCLLGSFGGLSGSENLF
jgi:hypothetical protein